MFKTIFSLLIIILMILPINSADRITGKTFTNHSEVIPRNGIIATSYTLASMIGTDMLKNGGILFLESGIPFKIVRNLISRGHKISFAREGYGCYQDIRIDVDKKIVIAANESKKIPIAMVY